MGSRFDDWIYWLFFTITVDYNSSHIELLLNDFCLTNLLLLSECRTDLYSLELSRIHECTAFYNCHAARIEDSTSNS
jgi:hypothetical protein